MFRQGFHPAATDEIVTRQRIEATETSHAIRNVENDRDEHVQSVENYKEHAYATADCDSCTKLLNDLDENVHELPLDD